ncbi:hypothetical protein K6W39_13120 [Burkholderia ambifaria]|nr:hypothetical protein [Burkholderia ambifaria]
MFVNGMVGGFGTLTSDGYPTAARYSFQTAIALLAGLYVLDMVATLFLIPELKGVELE